jgi:methylenetetrahydrofolate dehydrogenase (NADP+)/methenyltetrahydrofolate cyclohydrolase
METLVISGKELADRIVEEAAVRVAARVAAKGVRAPSLAAVMVGDNPASAVYLRNKKKACARAGIDYTLHTLPATATEAEVLELVARLNGDPLVDGILVQSPPPPQVDEQKVQELVSPAKDVDCFHPHNLGLVYQGRPRFLPCTPAGVMELLRHAGVDPRGKRAVVVGRSLIVGKPMAELLTQADATVTICHSKTRDLPALCREADILVAALGRPRFIGAEFVKPGACLIDVGVNRLPDGGICGDLDYDAVLPLAGAITPVPGGVGPMTVAMLVENVLRAWEGGAA